MAWVEEYLSQITNEAITQFQESQSVLTFEEYLSEVSKKPELHIRNCAQYFVDLVDSFGSYDIETPVKKLKRYRLFDADFCAQEGRIFGQEAIQHELISHFKNFV